MTHNNHNLQWNVVTNFHAKELVKLKQKAMQVIIYHGPCLHIIFVLSAAMENIYRAKVVRELKNNIKFKAKYFGLSPKH